MYTISESCEEISIKVLLSKEKVAIKKAFKI
jgi:hypothetical protein